jgi:hypothetical protein
MCPYDPMFLCGKKYIFELKNYLNPVMRLRKSNSTTCLPAGRFTIHHSRFTFSPDQNVRRSSRRQTLFSDHDDRIRIIHRDDLARSQSELCIQVEG